MKNKENFPKEVNEQIENKDGYTKYPENEDINNKFDKEFNIKPENISEINLNETSDDSEWKEMNFDLIHCGDDFDESNFEFDNEQENISNNDD